MSPVRRLAAVALLAGLVPARAPADDLSPLARRDQQKRVLAEVEQTARRIATTLRVMTYQKLDPGTEQKLLDEVATTLRGLSQDQIKAVLAHLDAAAKAPDDSVASAEQREAYQKHRQILSSLHGLLTRLDAVKSLDEAAARLDRMARDEHTLHLRALASASTRGRGQQPQRSNRPVVDEREEMGDAQGDLRTDMTGLIKQLAGLRPSLNPEQKDRLDRADVFGKGGRLVADMELSAQTVSAGNFKDTAERQLRTAKELQTLAAALRTPRDRISALKEARDKVEKAVRAEEELAAETAKGPDKERRPDRFREDPARVQARQLADKQSRVEFDTREVRKALEEVAKEAAAKLSPAEAEMKKAQEELRKQAFEAAEKPEEKAADRLREARDELDKQIAAAEREKADPLAAAKKAAELVDKLLAEQKRVREMTKNERDPDNLKPAADAQKDVAKATEEVRNLPLPESQPLKEALAKAADQTKQAADDLAVPDKAAARPKQDEAVKALEVAKKALEDKAKEIEKRREDIAKLDEAKKKLDELARQEKKLSDAAKADDPKTDALAKKQAELTPPTKDVGNQVKDVAPDAAKKIDQAGEKMDAAKAALDDKKPADGAEKAADAAQKLDEAAQELAKKADDLKAQEIADQAALQPNQVSPADAAQQVAKAIEQANKAAEQANKAADQLGQQPKSDRQPNLAELQKQVADRAEGLKQADAAKNAQQAAQALEKGDVQAALDQQKQALDKLTEAAKADGQPVPDGEKPGTAPDAKTPGQLAQNQKKIMEATEALAKSAQANQAAQAALNQAQALAPQAVQPQLSGAAQQLDQAGQQLGQGMPAEAGQNQQHAADKLGEALKALNQAAEQMGQQGAQPGQPQQAKGQPGQKGQQPGQGQEPGQPGDGKQPGQPGEKGQKPGEKGQKPGQKGQKGQSQEKNESRGEGDREGVSPKKDAASQGQAQAGDGSFINLQKREREKVQQNADAAFPAEFRELIKQYNINIKSAGKPQAGKPHAPKPAGK